MGAGKRGNVVQHANIYIYIYIYIIYSKEVPFQEVKVPDFMTTAKVVVRLSALRTGCLYPQKILMVLISVRG